MKNMLNTLINLALTVVVILGNDDEQEMVPR
jgi:hypothetical protein